MSVDQDGRVPDGTRLSSSTEPQEGLRPAGFDPSRISEMLATIEGKVLEPFIKKATDELYCQVLETAEDYFRDNLDWNLKSHLEMLERENQRMRTELYDVDRVLGGRMMAHEGRMDALRALDTAAIERAELLFAVSRVYERETRFATALRYIRERDSDGSGEAGETALAGSTEGDSAGRQASPKPKPAQS